VKLFAAPKKTLGSLDADTAAIVLSATADMALIVDGKGVIRDVAFGRDDLQAALPDSEAWVGRRWMEVVTVESRPKVQALLREAASNGAPRWRHVNYPSHRDSDEPVLHAAVQTGQAGRVVTVGRSLGELSALQQRLVSAQQSLERDYLRFRNAETRYRMLFRFSSEAILIIDAQSQKILDANPAADRLLGGGEGGAAARLLVDAFDDESIARVRGLLATVQAVGDADSVQARVRGANHDCQVSASLVRQEQDCLLLVRIASPDGPSIDPVSRSAKAQVLRVVESVPDGFVLTDLDGRVRATNQAFLELAQLATEEQARGEPLDRWLGRQGLDLGVLTANLRQHGNVRLFATTIRGEFGSTTEVEISGVAVTGGEHVSFGFMIRDVARRVTSTTRSSRVLTRSVEQLTELVGRVSLKEIVREATDVIERLCIEAALEVTEDNRASAAELLGLSRQSLYVKLHRYGLGELASEGGK
jgi:transcriptional regulator PpsR